MSEKERQTTDSDQGGEGTNSFHNKSYEALTKDIGLNPIGNTTGGEKPLDDGTK
jgi:hypothetical protein